MAQFIALDLGAESGRVIVADVRDDGIRLDECHRFSNGPVRVRGTLRWDGLGLLREIKAGLRKASQKYGREFVSLGVDTWGIDYALLDRNGDLVSNPFCYRDPRTDGVMERVLEVIPRQEIFEKSSGIQFLSINTLYQLYSMVLAGSQQLGIADTFLMMPDLFNYWLTGRKTNEFTNATRPSSMTLGRKDGLPIFCARWEYLSICFRRLSSRVPRSDTCWSKYKRIRAFPLCRSWRRPRTTRRRRWWPFPQRGKDLRGSAPAPGRCPAHCRPSLWYRPRPCRTTSAATVAPVAVSCRGRMSWVSG